MFVIVKVFAVGLQLHFSMRLPFGEFLHADAPRDHRQVSGKAAFRTKLA